MKKKLLMVALMSAAMGLASCGQQAASSPEGSHASVSESTSQSNESKESKESEESKESSVSTEASSVAHVHRWGAPTYTWGDEHADCTAKRVCLDDPTHVEEETATADVQTDPATCTEDGTATYTVTFENEAFEEQTFVDTLSATDHDWGDPEYTWSDDYSECTATRTCLNDSEHIETETVKSTYETAGHGDPTEEQGAFVNFIATFENEAFEQQIELDYLDCLPAMSKLFFSLNEDEESYSVSMNDSNISGCVRIPKEVNDLPVTAIESSGFFGTSITRVIIPSTVVSIGTSAFGACTALEKVDFEGEASGFTLGQGAFENCSKIERIYLHQSITEIPYRAFKNCSKLDYVDFVSLLKQVTVIGEEAYQDCGSLKTVVLSTTLKEIKSRAFDGCYQIEPFFWGYADDWAKLVIGEGAFPDTIAGVDSWEGTLPL